MCVCARETIAMCLKGGSNNGLCQTCKILLFHFYFLGANVPSFDCLRVWFDFQAKNPR